MGLRSYGRRVVRSYGLTVLRSYGLTVVRSYGRTVVHPNFFWRDGLLRYCIIMGLRSASATINTISTRYVTRMKKNINLLIQ